MTDKLCQMYEEEQVSKTRNDRKLVPDNIMPSLSWNLAKQDNTKQEDIQHLEGTNRQNKTIQALLRTIIIIYTYTLLVNDIISQKLKILAKTVKNTIRAIEDFSRTSWTKIQEETQTRRRHTRTYRDNLRNRSYRSYDYHSGHTASQ